MSTELEIKQWEHFEGDDWWKWAVWIEGTDEALDQIEYVEWTLHPSFPNPVRRVTNRAEKFRIDSGGWGVFTIHARVEKKDRNSVRLRHYLRLHRSDGSENTS
jgi:transcription initiation factor IIF auxiliary subunit